MSSLPLQQSTHQHLSYLPAAFINMSLPIARTKVPVWVRVNGNSHMAISAGYGVGPDSCAGFIPYGRYARAALIVICTQAKLTGQNTLTISDSYRGFMNQLGLKWSRPNADQAILQIQALAASTITITTTGITDAGEIAVDANRFVISFRDHMVFKSDHKGDLSEKSPSTLELSPQFLELIDQAVPIVTDAWLWLLHNSRSAMALDIFTWLSYRLFDLKRPQHISWSQLHQQFGSEASLKLFKLRFRESLELVKLAYPQANVTEFGEGARGSTHGLLLKHSKRATECEWVVPQLPESDK